MSPQRPLSTVHPTIYATLEHINATSCS